MPEKALFVTGLKDIDKALSKFENRVQRSTMRKATRQAMKEVVLPDAKRHVPVDTGELQRTLKVRAVKRRRNVQGHQVVTTADVGRVFDGETYYGAFVELGTAKMEAQPFLRPALWTNTKQVMAVVVRELRAEIAKIRPGSSRG